MRQALSSLMVYPFGQPPSWHAVPSRVAATFEIHSKAPNQAAQLVSWTLDERRATRNTPHQTTAAASAASSLDASWASHHSILEHDKADAITGVKTTRGSRCWEAGFCVCRGLGLKKQKFRTAFLKVLRNSFPVESPSLVGHLKNRLVFMRFVSCPADGLSPDENSSYHVAPSEQSRIVHLGAMYFSPFRPTFQHMRLWQVEPDTGILDLGAMSLFCTLWRFVQDLDMNMWWAVQPYILLERRRPLDCFDPSHASAKPLGGCVTFWNPNKKAGRGRHAREIELALAVASVGDAPDPEVEAVDPGDPINDEKEVNEDEDELLEHAFGELDIDVPLQGDDTPVAEPDYEPPFDEDDGDGNGDDGIGDLGGSAASGGASSSGVPPPPAPEASRPRHYGGRRAGEVSVVLLGYGKITYYSNGNYFEAVCGQKHHARCVAKRMAASNVRIPWQGRPCGFLAAWLVMGASITLKAEHAKHKPTQDERLLARVMFFAENPEFEALTTYERPQRDDEPVEEPEQFE